MEKFEVITAIAAPFVHANVDTDRIIRIERCARVARKDMGLWAFESERFMPDGTDNPEFILNQAPFVNAGILIASENFGCGSSREHAPQALYRFGFRAIIAQSFAEIFFGNCTTLGIPCVSAAAEDIAQLAAAIEKDPQIEVNVNVESKVVTFGAHSFAISMPSTAREGLLSGKWDPIAELLDNKAAVHERLKALGFAQAA